jgi:hypothetical protein
MDHQEARRRMLFILVIAIAITVAQQRSRQRRWLYKAPLPYNLTPMID